MNRTLITMIIFASTTLAVLFAMIGSSFALPPDPVETACAKKENGQLRAVSCSSNADCLPSEVCVEVGGGGGGTNGMDGASCWDTNSNGTNGECDEGEDINGDGFCTVDDCQGLPCWDLNGNLTCDIDPEPPDVNEDINDDGVCDTLDCKGPQGDQGPATCPSIIGGAGAATGAGAMYMPYFTSGYGSESSAKMIIGAAGSIRRLDVQLFNSIGALSFQFTLRHNEGDTALDCTIPMPSPAPPGGTSCFDVSADKTECVSVEAGDTLDVEANPSANPTSLNPDPLFRHTAVFNGCECCDGKPPVPLMQDEMPTGPATCVRTCCAYDSGSACVEGVTAAECTSLSGDFGSTGDVCQTDNTCGPPVQ